MLAELERRVRWASHQKDSWVSRYGHIQSEYNRVVAMHDAMNKSLLEEVKAMEQEVNEAESVLEQRQAELDEFKAGISKDQKPKKEENGKILCDLCNEQFAPQGYPAHRAKCERIKALEEELSQLEGE